MKKQQKIDVTNKKNHGLPVILFLWMNEKKKLIPKRLKNK